SRHQEQQGQSRALSRQAAAFHRRSTVLDQHTTQRGGGSYMFANLIAAATSFPTASYTVLLGVVLVYWLLAIVGMVDFESSGIDLDIEAHADASADDLGAIASYVVAFGLNGVPFSIVVSLLVLVGWTLSCIAG